jgi:Domain of unknown function (DUF362)
MKRRDFLKRTAIAGAAVSIGPVVNGMALGQTVKSKVVIANDPQCYANNIVNAARVQDMVDHAVMALTGQTVKAAAYEALFPNPITTATKIAIKYNESSSGSSPTINTVRDALISGLTSMVNGTYPANKINVITSGTGGSANGPQFTIGGTSYRMKDDIVNCDYLINLPICWAVGSNTAGVTLSMKNNMGSVGAGPLSAGIHSNIQNSSAPSLSILNSQQMFKDKQVLVLIDAITLCTEASGPAGMANAVAYSIIASKDTVAADYQGLQILKAKGLSSDRQAVANTILVNAAKPVYGLGTNDPNSMDIVNIGPPWTTKVVVTGEKSERMGLQVCIDHRDGVVFVLKNQPAGGVNLSIYAANGMQIWSHNSLAWKGETFSGQKAARGSYFYSIKAGRETLNGKIMVEN